MNRTRIIMNALLAGAALFAAGNAAAQPHTDPPINSTVALPVTDPAQIAEWLQRLVGRFRFDGMVQQGDLCADLPPDGSEAADAPPKSPKGGSDKCQSVKGKSDCIPIGQGAGVQCILNVYWEDIYETDPDNGTTTELLPSYLNPAMELFGLDPGKSAINRMIVNNKGLPEGGLGYIKGNTATFRSPCVNEPVGCYRIVRIEAKPDAKLVWWKLSLQHTPDDEMSYGVMTLRRVAKEEEGGPTLKPPPILKPPGQKK